MFPQFPTSSDGISLPNNMTIVHGHQLCLDDDVRLVQRSGEWLQMETKSILTERQGRWSFGEEADWS